MNVLHFKYSKNIRKILKVNNCFITPKQDDFAVETLKIFKSEKKHVIKSTHNVKMLLADIEEVSEFLNTIISADSKELKTYAWKS